MEHYRKRRIETPSDVGGLSQEARDRIGAHKKDRDRYKGAIILPLSIHLNCTLEGGLFLQSKQGLEYREKRSLRSEWDQTPRHLTSTYSGHSTPRLSNM